jgi:hypothetical protein
LRERFDLADIGEDLQKRVGTETNTRSGNLFGSTGQESLDPGIFAGRFVKTRTAAYQATLVLAQALSELD